MARDEITGDLILSSRPNAKTWDNFFALMRSIDVPTEFMAERPMHTPPLERERFAGED